jgi:hypothetical protein
VSETATLDPETSTTELSATSDDAAAVVSQGEQPTGAEEQAAASTEPASPVVVRERTPQEIEAVLQTGGELRPGEHQRYTSWQQSMRDTRARIDQQRTEFDTTLTSAQDLALGHIQAELNAAMEKGRDPDLDLLKDKLGLVFGTVKQKAIPAAVAEVDAEVDAWLYQAYGGATAGYEAATKGKTFKEKLAIQLDTAYQIGRNAGPEEGSIVFKSQAELDAHVKAEINKAKPANTGTSVGGGDAAISSTQQMTLAQIDAMKTNDWLAVGRTDADGGRARRQTILDNARRAGR